MLLEAISVHILLSGDARRNRDDLLDLCLSLPFQSEPNTGFGILAKTYLDAATIYFGDTITEESVQADAGKVAEAKGQALKFIEQSFESVKGPVEEVKRGFRFWDAVSWPGVSVESVLMLDRSCRLYGLSLLLRVPRRHCPPRRSSPRWWSSLSGRISG